MRTEKQFEHVKPTTLFATPRTWEEVKIRQVATTICVALYGEGSVRPIAVKATHEVKVRAALVSGAKNSVRKKQAVGSIALRRSSPK